MSRIENKVIKTMPHNSICFARFAYAHANENKPFSYSEKESQSSDTLLHFVEISNVHNVVIKALRPVL